MQQQTFAVTVKLWQVVFCDARDSEVATRQNPRGQRKGRNNVAEPKLRPGSKNVFGKFKNILLSRRRFYVASGSRRGNIWETLKNN